MLCSPSTPTNGGKIKQIDNQIKPLEVELQRAPTEVITAMKSRYESALAREEMLRSSYNAQHGTTTEQTKHQIEMVAMGQQIETDKQYLNTLCAEGERSLQWTARSAQ